MERQSTVELQQELKSLKGLLLNRRQFPLPATSTTTANVSSVPATKALPSWQLKADPLGSVDLTSAATDVSSDTEPEKPIELKSDPSSVGASGFAQHEE
jgi:hypothetical protein